MFSHQHSHPAASDMHEHPNSQLIPQSSSWHSGMFAPPLRRRDDPGLPARIQIRSYACTDGKNRVNAVSSSARSMRSCGLSLSCPRGAAICRRRDRKVAVSLFEMTREDLMECKPVTFTHLEIKERAGLRHVLRDHIEVIGYPDPSGPGSPPRSCRRRRHGGTGRTGHAMGRCGRRVDHTGRAGMALAYLITISLRARVHAGKHVPARPRPTRIAFGMSGHLILAI